MMTRPTLTVAMLTLGLCLSGHHAQASEFIARGSDSTIQLMRTLADAYKTQGGAHVRIEGGGSSKGAKDCLAGEIPLAFLSRALNQEENDAGLKGVSYAFDGVVVIVSTANPVVNLTTDELKSFFAGETAQWPDGKPVVLIDRNHNSGTRDVFIDAVMGKTAVSPKAMVKHDALIESTVEKTPTAIGYTSGGAVGTGVKHLTINGVAPSAETIRQKTYPLARSLTLATKGEPTAEVKAFIDYVLSEQGQTVVATAGGYVRMQAK